jgi:AraC-like DNA-binding protein
MFYRRYTPPPPLAAFVGCIWYAEGFEGTHTQERLLPNGESAIVIDLRDGLEETVRVEPICLHDAHEIRKIESSASAVFCGARTDCFVIDTSQQERVIGIQFRPGGAFPFLAMPASEVAGTTYSLDDVWPGCATLLRDELMSAGSVDGMFAILERTLISRMGKTSSLHPAIAFAACQLARSAQDLRVGDVADRVGFSSRRFMELFREQTGLAPKAFQRVRRWQWTAATMIRLISFMTSEHLRA